MILGRRAILDARPPSCGGVGWPTGLEPVTSGATTRRSRHDLCVKPAGSWPRLLQTAAISRSNARSQSQHAGAAEHRGVADVERCTASGQRHDVVDGRVGGAVGVALVAGAPVAVLAKPRSQHVGAESLPRPRAVDRAVPARAGAPRVRGAAAPSAAGDDTTDRAQLHPRIVGRVAGAVYSLRVLRLQARSFPATRAPSGGRRAPVHSVRADPRIAPSEQAPSELTRSSFQSLANALMARLDAARMGDRNR